jgi:D-inositol-3-phosphate glycosyltransferase
MNPFASAAPQPLRVALIDAVGATPLRAEPPFCPDTGPHAVEMLARGLARCGHAVDIYRSRADGEPVWEDLQSGVRIHRIAQTAPWPEHGQAQLSQAVQAFVGGMRHLARGVYPFDVVHAFGMNAGLAGLRLTRGVSAPFILSLKPQDDADAERLAVEDLLVRRADGLIAHSERNRDALCGLHAASRAALHLVPRGVDTQCFRPGRKAQLRRELGWPEDAFIVMWGGTAKTDVARLREGLSVFRAASRLSGAHVVVCGADSPWPAETAGIPSVSVVDLDEAAQGMARNARLSACYAACDLLVLPPWHREVDDINAKEAMACGTPVMVMTDRAGDEAARAVEDGVTGYVLHRPTPEMVLQRLRTLCEQPRRRAAMGMAAILRARTFYTWQKVAERVANVYANTHRPERFAHDRRALTLISTGAPRRTATVASLVPVGA